MIALFIDGPLAGETKTVPPSSDSRYCVPLPRRVTTCVCDPEIQTDHEQPAGVFTYHLVARGRSVLIYTESENDEDIVHSLKQWRESDFSVPTWFTNCHDRRAFR